MARSALLVLPAVAVVLVSCGPRQLVLSDDPVQRAATCGVVAAARARSATVDIRAPLSIEAQGQIMYPALVTAIEEGNGFSVAKAAEVVNTMTKVEATVTSGKFDALAAPCNAAYPQPAADAKITLPADGFVARVGCYELGGFMNRALLENGNAYADILARYGAMRRELDAAIGSALTSRGISSKSDQAKTLRSEAMARMVKLGSPTRVLDVCLERFDGSGARRA